MKVLIIVGSLRKKSFNRQLAEYIRSKVDAETSILEYSDIPFMNQDIENPVPDSIARVRREVEAADVLWICTPEYNAQIPGVLKNLLDWLSRPADPTDRESASVIKGKKAIISGVGGRNATAGSRARLKELLVFMGVEVIGGEGEGFSLTGPEYVSDELVITEDIVSRIEGQVELIKCELPAGSSTQV